MILLREGATSTAGVRRSEDVTPGRCLTVGGTFKALRGSASAAGAATLRGNDFWAPGGTYIGLARLRLAVAIRVV